MNQFLGCRSCGERIEFNPETVCPSCFSPLEVVYDYAQIRDTLPRSATEVLKLILIRSGHSVGNNLKNRMLVYDAKEPSFRTVKLTKNPECPVCANPDFNFREVKYENSCGINNIEARG